MNISLNPSSPRGLLFCDTTTKASLQFRLTPTRRDCQSLCNKVADHAVSIQQRENKGQVMKRRRKNKEIRTRRRTETGETFTEPRFPVVPSRTSTGASYGLAHSQCLCSSKVFLIEGVSDTDLREERLDNERNYRPC